MVTARDEGRVISPVLEVLVEKKIAGKHFRGVQVQAVLPEHKYCCNCVCRGDGPETAQEEGFIMRTVAVIRSLGSSFEPQLKLRLNSVSYVGNYQTHCQNFIHNWFPGARRTA